jgi:hypothetical protein
MGVPLCCSAASPGPGGHGNVDDAVDASSSLASSVPIDGRAEPRQAVDWHRLDATTGKPVPVAEVFAH